MPRHACPSCGSPDEVGSFCGQCGTALLPAGRPGPAGSTTPTAPPAQRGSEPRTAERRVTSVLFGDLVGFTPLSAERDPEEVRDLLSAYFARCRVVIGRYGGVVEKFAGDAVMAVWGVPAAHEDDAERAVRAGLELVATVAGVDEGTGGLSMRVGVVTGEVAVTVGATGEGMVAGDAVNVAARVQTVAAPGRVWVDDATREVTSAAITYADVGEHLLKGKAEPIQLWQAGVVVADVGGGQRVDGLEAPLAGRGSEMAVVKELFHATEDSKQPRLVVLDGVAGVGKSRMAWELEKYLDGLSGTTFWHRGRCLSYGGGNAFWALSEALRTRLGLVVSDSGPPVIEHLETGLARYVDDPAERDWLRPRLAVLLGIASGSSYVRADMFAAWTAFLEHLAEHGGTVVLVIDDAQYADDGLLDFVEHVLLAARAPILVLALARPELLSRRPDLGGRRATVVRLQPLPGAAMTALVDDLVSDLPALSRAALVRRAEGIPLFAVETVRALIDRGLVVPRNGRHVPADDAQLDIDSVGAPASLQALAAARLDALTAEEKRLVVDASVLGVTFAREGLVALGNDPRTLDDLLASLIRKEIFAIQTDRFSAERGQYSFVQSVLHLVAYSGQARRDRKARHVAAASHLAAQADSGDDLAVLIATHLLDAVEAAPPSDPDAPRLRADAREHLERGAVRARRVGALGEAQLLWEQALELAPDLADRARIRLEAAGAAVDAGRYAAAAEHAVAAAAAFDELGDPVQAASATAIRATALLSLGDNTGAAELAEPRWRDVRGKPGAERAELALITALSRAAQRRGAWRDAPPYTERILVLAERLDDPAALADAHIHMGLRYQAIGAPSSSLRSYETAIDIARGHDLLAPLARALINLAAAQMSRDLPTSIRHSGEAVEVCRRAGLQTWSEFSTLNYIIGLWVAARYDELGPMLADAWEAFTDDSLMPSLATLDCWLADARGEVGEEARWAGVADAPTDDESTLAWMTARDIAQALSRGDTGRAASLAGDGMDHLLAAAGLDDDFMVLWPRFVLAALGGGDVELAERLLAPVAAVPPGLVAPGVAAQWHRLRGLVGAARGDAASVVEHDLREGIARLEAFGAVAECARAKVELARWLIDQDRRHESDELIEAARAAFARTGADGWLAELDAWTGSRAPADQQLRSR